MTPLLLDLFCGEGGASEGYSRAGYIPIGVDIDRMPNYPFDFIQSDALSLLSWLIMGQTFTTAQRTFTLADIALIHASPPCQAYSRAGRVFKLEHPDLIPQTRELLKLAGKPYVIENVEFAPLNATLLLCGTMFGLNCRRHRLFESNLDLGFSPYACSCRNGVIRGDLMNYHNTAQRHRYADKHGYDNHALAFREALGVEWMSFNGSQEAIPPAYCKFIGDHLITHVLA